MGALKQLMVDAMEEEQPADPVVPSDTVTTPHVYRCPCTGQLTMNCECGPVVSVVSNNWKQILLDKLRNLW